MKFEKITDTKIRIIISLQDMKLNNLSVENVLSNSADSQKLLNDLITKAEKELGFKPDDSKLLVEAIALDNNDCVFTITKLLNDEIGHSGNNNLLIYEFTTFDDFINMCTFLNNFGFLCLKEISKNFSLIYCNGTYFLRFIDVGGSSIVIDYIKTLFTEFGKDVSHFVGIDGILNEYGKIIFSKNAILKCLNSFNVKKI